MGIGKGREGEVRKGEAEESKNGERGEERRKIGRGERGKGFMASLRTSILPLI